MKEAFTPVDQTCGGCNTILVSSLFCFSCNHLQQLRSRPDYFNVFGLTPHYNVDLKQLDELYEQLVGELHPDFYSTESSEKQKRSEHLSALLNRAYETLKDPGVRAAYMLSTLADQISLNERQLPNGFLEEMFEFQESIDELTSSDQAALHKIEEDIQQRLTQNESQFKHLFSQIEEDASASQEQLQEIQTQVNVERYLKRLLERCSAL